MKNNKLIIAHISKTKMCECDLELGVDALSNLFYEIGPEYERRLLEFESKTEVELEFYQVAEVGYIK